MASFAPPCIFPEYPWDFIRGNENTFILSDKWNELDETLNCQEVSEVLTYYVYNSIGELRVTGLPVVRPLSVALSRFTSSIFLANQSAVFAPLERKDVQPAYMLYLVRAFHFVMQSNKATKQKFARLAYFLTISFSLRSVRLMLSSIS